MAGESKTEKATPKKRQDERKKGNVFLSKDAVTVVSLIGVFYILKLFFPRMYSAIKEYILQIFYYAGTTSDISQDFGMDLARGFASAFIRIGFPVMLVALAIPVVVTLAQTKLMFSTESLKPKFSRINPIEGFKRLFSMRSLFEVIKSTIKIAVLFYLLYKFVAEKIYYFPQTLSMDVMSSCVFVLDSVMDLVIKIAMVFLAISVLDYFYQWLDYEKQIKMTKQEVKEEYKQTEGDPQIKSKIKSMQKKIAMQRMMQEVPHADVVIKNPTHYAVALKYDMKRTRLP